MDKSIEELLNRTITGEWGIEALDKEGVKVIKTTNFTNEGKLNLEEVAIRNIPEHVIKDKKLKYGDIILEKSGGSDNFAVGRVVYFDIKSDKNYLCNNFTQILRVNNKIANSKYVFYYLLNLHKKGITKNLQNKTTGIRNLQIKRYLSQRIFLPPIEIQNKIVSILGKCESVKEKRKEANRLTDEFLKSTFLEMFGDPIGNPKKWDIKKIGNICSVESGGTPSTNRKEYWQNGNIHWLGSTACKDRFIKESKEYITEEGLRNSSAKLFKEKTTLIALVGATIGKTGFLTFESTTNQNIAGIYPLDRNFLVPEYLFFVTQYLYPKFMGLSRSGFKMANLSFVRGMDIPVSPIELQQKFAKIVQKVEKLKEKQHKSEKELNNLFDSLMQKAFKGELI